MSLLHTFDKGFLLIYVVEGIIACFETKINLVHLVCPVAVISENIFSGIYLQARAFQSDLPWLPSLVNISRSIMYTVPVWTILCMGCMCHFDSYIFLDGLYHARLYSSIENSAANFRLFVRSKKYWLICNMPRCCKSPSYLSVVKPKHSWIFPCYHWNMENLIAIPVSRCYPACINVISLWEFWACSHYQKQDPQKNLSSFSFFHD